MTDALTSYKDAVAAVQEAQENAKKVAKDAFTDGTKAIFSEYGDVLSGFGWHQFTPYFNDGEPCEFGVHDIWCAHPDDPMFEEYDDRERALSAILDEEGSEQFSTWRNDNPDKRCQQAGEAVREFFGAFDEDTFKFLFGDHTEVLVFPDKVVTEHYAPY